MQRSVTPMTDHLAVIPLMGISLGTAILCLFGSTSIAKADDTLGFSVHLATSSSSTLAEPAPTVLTRKDSLSRHAAVTILADVHTPGDLEAYAAALLRNDSRITRIELSPQRVTMTYRSQESVAGFGLRTVERTISITDDGEVTINRPWYTQGDGKTNSPESGFTDLMLIRTKEGFTPETEARILTRMQGRFVLGNL